MKKVIFTLFFIGTAICSFSQNTYYWVGGTTGSWTTSTSWNAQIDASGLARTSPNNADVLIFDGTNIGGGVPATGQVIPAITGSVTIAQLKLQNAADVVLQRSTAGTSTYTIAGDVTAADDFTEDAGSKLKLTCPVSGQGFVLLLGVAGTPATATVNGTITIIDNGFGTNRFITPNPACINFTAGSFFYSKMTTASSYPFGGTGTTPPAASGSVTFKQGSTLVYQGGNSVFGTTSTFSPIIFETGSNMVFEAANTTSMFGSRTYANVIVRPLASAPATPVTVTIDGNHYNIDTLTIDPLATFNLRISGTAPFSGDIINNGTFGAPSATTSNFLMVGSVPQSIRGTGTFNSLGALSIGTGASVTLQKSLVLAGTATSSITGKLNLLNNTISLTNSGGFQFRGAAINSYPGNTTIGLNDVTTSSTSGVVLGALVTGPGISANTYIISTSGNNYTLSKPATATGAGVTLTSTGNAATVETSNPAGVDASITTVSSTRTFSSTTNYIFDAATTTPFSDVSNVNASTNAGNVTFNAAATTNRVMTVNGTLSLNSGKLTIRPADTVRVSISGNIAGTFDASKYIATDVSGANVGVLRIDSFSIAKTFPVGTPAYYMPVTLTPTTQSTFAVSVFQGITEDGTPTGTPFTPTKKANVVDAVWTINRMTSNTDACNVNVTWPQVLEGANFSVFPNSQVGIARNNAGAWELASGTGDNTNNNATSTFSNFSPFGVGQVGAPLPVKFSSIIAKAEQGKIKLQWNNDVEINTSAYVIERSENGATFTAIGSVTANGNHQYEWYDNSPLATNNYYRILVKDRDGNSSYSNIVRVKLNIANPGLSVYPNPVSNHQLNLQLSNLTKGKIEVNLYNSTGQLIFNSFIEYSGGIQAQAVQLPLNISKGNYSLVVKDETNLMKQKIIIQ